MEVDARTAAQHLAFGPLAFQAARVLRDAGVLAFARDRGDVGFVAAEVVEATTLSSYAVAVLLDAGTSSGLFTSTEGRYRLAPVGLYVLKDEMTRVNMDFVHDVCYRGAHALDRSLAEGRPVGLEAPYLSDKVPSLGTLELPPVSAGGAPSDSEGTPIPGVPGRNPSVARAPGTVYEALAGLPEAFRRSWFAFDHYYSDAAFPVVLPRVLARRPRRLLDCGGNTGRWAGLVLGADPLVRVTIADHPGQLAVARAGLADRGLADRLDTVAIDFRDATALLPTGHDVIWMSQFLDCFSEPEITSILGRARDAMDPDARLFVLETFWDRQARPTAAYVLAMTSLYFAAIANGTSRMYHAADLARCIAAAGLVVEDEVDGIGHGHTLLVLRRDAR